MRSYWLRILLGAIAVFAVGMIVVSMIRRGRTRVESVLASSDPISIPLAFVPFQLDGSKLGTLEHAVVNRDSPKKVSSIDLQVKLDDSLVAQGLAGCRLAANIEDDSSGRGGHVNLHVNQLERRTFFFCAPSDSGFEEFGSVAFSPGDVKVPLLVPEELAGRLQSGDWADSSDAADSADAMADRADSIAEAAQEKADSGVARGMRAAPRAEARRDSLGRAHSRLGDSLRAEGLRRADSIQRSLAPMADSLGAR
jgi:hypothetical protein